MSSLVTIVIPTHNRPDYLFRSLLSIKLQTFEDFECIIFGDNCDFSESVYLDLLSNDKRFIYLKLTGKKILNTGAVGRRIAIDYCDSKYIGYCDDDNIVLPNHLKILYAAISRGKHNVVLSSLKHIDYNESPTFDILNRDLYDIDHHKFKVTIQNFDTIVLMHTRKSCMDVGSWIPYNGKEEHRNEDGNFIRNLRKINKILSLSDITAIYNQHSKVVDEAYKRQVLELKKKNEIYVYPDLITNLKNKYL